jgi:hypothetical protein
VNGIVDMFEQNPILTGFDHLIGALIGTSALVIGLVATRKSPDRSTIMAALLVKLLACYAMCVMTVPVFGGGDMSGYHNHGIRYADLLTADLADGTNQYLATTPFFLLSASNTKRAWSFSGLVHFLTFNSFVAASVVFSMIGFLGQVYLYRTFVTEYPTYRLRVYWKAGLLFMPSVTFWSAGLLKDPLGLWGLGYAVWGAYSLFRHRRYSGLVRLVLGVYALLLFRASVAPVVLIAAVPLLFRFRLAPTPDGRPRRASYGLVVLRLVYLVSCAWFLTHAGQIDDRISFANVSDSLLVQRHNFSYTVGGSTVGDLTLFESRAEASLLQMLWMWPEAVAFSLFRPFLWEGFRSPTILAAALENTVLLVLAARALLLAFFHPRSLSAALRGSLFLPCVIFVAGFAFALGVATPNFGTISRYRIPLIPFFIGAIGILEFHYQENRHRRSVVAPVAEGTASPRDRIAMGQVPGPGPVAPSRRQIGPAKTTAMAPPGAEDRSQDLGRTHPERVP